MKYFDKILKTMSSRVALFYILVVIGIAAELMSLSYLIGDNSTFRLRTVIYLSDGAVLLLFYWFCAPRLRWLSLPMVWLVSLFVLANVLYFRYWNDLIPLQSIFVANNYNSFVFRSIWPLFRPEDSLYPAVPILATILYFVIRPSKDPSLKLKSKLLMVAFTVALYALGFYLSVNSVRHWHQIVGYPEMPVKDIIANRYGHDSTQFGMWKNNGLCGFIITQIINYPDDTVIDLDERQKVSTQKFIDERRLAAADSTCLVHNRGKNLVFIIVESLNSWTIGKTYGDRRLTPVLSSLVESDSVISCLSMLAQINDGGSSDGQLIYNTGLLPLLNGVVAQTFAQNRFPSLAEAIRPASSAEFIVESANVYNHRMTSQAFGYEAIHDLDSLHAVGWDKTLKGADDAVLDYAFDRITTMPQPFIAEITTLSMHYPFEIEGFEPVEWIDSIAPDDYYLNHYLQTVHYTDAAIGRFLARLKASDLADNTIVVIASDHDEIAAQRTVSETSPVDSPIAFIVLGAGVTKHLDRPMGQVDVFPTLLDVMGVGREQYYWRGLGESVLSDSVDAAISRTGRLAGNPDKQTELRLRRMFELSDTLIRSNYFAN